MNDQDEEPEEAEEPLDERDEREREYIRDRSEVFEPAPRLFG